MDRICLFPGTFDPVTKGHTDVIERAVSLFDKLIIGVGINSTKQPMFSIEQRVAQITQCTEHLANVEIDSFSGLTVEYARLRQAGVLLRGLRVLSDFEKELQMAHTNKTLWSDIETVFLATTKEYSFLSSSVVKEIARFGGPVSHLVTENVAKDLYNRYGHE